MNRFLSSELAKWVGHSRWSLPRNSGASLPSVESNTWNPLNGDIDNLLISGVSHDTRTLNDGDVYLAINGEQFDGHDFVEQAVEKGAAGIIVDRELPAVRVPQLIVPDTMEALWQMAAGVRREWTGTVIGITGSVGKTTVKEMIASVLVQKGTVAKTPGNWNNDIGLPLSMLSADRTADFFVFELGMNHPGEIDRLSRLLAPDWALITAIGKAHTEFFDSLEGIADEKASILRHAKHALLDEDSEWFSRMKTQFSGSVTPLTTEIFRVAQPGAYMIQNARFAATLGLELGLSAEEVQKGLDIFENAPMRWQTFKKDGVLFINDAYNANPLSMRAAISTFADLPCEGRKFLVLGGMRELGSQSAQEHRSLGEFVDSFSFDCVITMGPLGALMACRGRIGIEKSAVCALLRDHLRAGDMVLFKASRGEQLEIILEKLKSLLD